VIDFMIYIELRKYGNWEQKLVGS